MLGQEGYEYSYLIMRWYRIHWDDRYNFTAKQLKKPTGASATASNILKWKKYVLREGHLYRNSYATKVFLLKQFLFLSLISMAFVDICWSGRWSFGNQYHQGCI